MTRHGTRLLRWIILLTLYLGSIAGLYAQTFADCQQKFMAILPDYNRAFEEHNMSLLKAPEYQKKLRQLQIAYDRYHASRYEVGDSLLKQNNEAVLASLSGSFHQAHRIFGNADFTGQPDQMRYNRGLISIMAGKLESAQADWAGLESNAGVLINSLYGYGKKGLIQEGMNYLEGQNAGRQPGKWHYNSGLFYKHNQQYEKAIEEVSTAIKQKNELGVYRLLRGDLYMSQQEDKRAVKDFEKVSRRYPKAQIRYANALLSTHEYGKAREMFDRYLATKETRYKNEAYLGLGHAYYGLQQLDEAMRYYRLAASTMRETPALLCGIGNVHLSKREYEFAFNLFDRAVKIDSSFANAFLGRAVAHYGMQHFSQALSDFESGALALSEQNPYHADLFVTKGFSAYHLGLTEVAEKAFQTALTLDPKRYEAMGGLSNILISRKQYSGAGTFLAKALNLEKGYSEMWSNYGNLLLHFDMFNKAYPVFKTAISLKTDNLNAQNGWGVVMLENDRLDRAMALFDSLITEHPDKSFLHNNHGIVQSYLGNRHEQRRQLEEANERYEGAFKDFKKAMEVAPTRKFYNVNQGNVYRYWEKYDQAQLSYQNYQDKSALNNTAVMFAGREMLKDAKYYLGVALQIDSLHRVFQYNMDILAKGKQKEMMRLVASTGDDGPYSDIGIKYSRDGFVTIYLYDYVYDTLTFPGRHFMPLPVSKYKEDYFIPELDFNLLAYDSKPALVEAKRKVKYRSQKIKMPGRKSKSGTQCPLLWR
ncbi:tetratricopeptide repeat protein [Dyadobacter tibetensis]|uniref:tetratricopeptide repeat protein n=1 Tax=Dyadobacter tibetensis TaxID=1211851 RepID=UPI00046E6702|nr:tetratricopeptide repeat protein [Dyadobacter tibetensis]